MLHLIVAIDLDRAIGRGGNLIYRIPADLRSFKALTTGNTVIMGRRTYESLPNGPLPRRRNIVVTSATIPGLETARSLEEALDMASAGPGEPFILGGAQLYAAALPLADILHVTAIDEHCPDADTFFPEISPDLFEAVSYEPVSDSPRATLITYRRK